MNTDNKATITTQAIIWWGLLTINERREAVRRYYPSSDKEHGFNRAYLFIGNNAIENIYLSEHPQQTAKEDSVVSLGNALRKQFYNAGYNEGDTPLKLYLKGGEFGTSIIQKQYSELLYSYRELLEALTTSEDVDNDEHDFDDLECFVDDAETRDDFNDEYQRRVKNRRLIKQATNILNNRK